MPHYLCVVGPPGSGKSTQIRLLSEAFSADKQVIELSVPSLARLRPGIDRFLTDLERDAVSRNSAAASAARMQGQLAPIFFDQLLFEIALRVPKDSLVVFNGAPRGLSQAGLFLSMPALTTQSTIVHLQFHDRCVEQSIHRQTDREIASHGLDAAHTKRERFQNKADTYWHDTRAGIRLLIDAGLRVCDVDATAAVEAISAQIQSFVALVTKASAQPQRFR